MAKVRVVEDWRVEITPDDRFSHRWWKGPDYRNACEEIEKQVKRHVDGFGSMEIKYTERDACSFCDDNWEVDEDGVPMCCDNAIKEHEAAQKETGPVI